MTDLITWAPRKGTAGLEKYELPQCLIVDRATTAGVNCRLATTEPLPSYDDWPQGEMQAFYDPGADGDGAYLEGQENGALGNINGKAPNVNDIVLVKCQWNHAHNGPYVIDSVGGAASKWKMTRHTDYDQGEDFPRGLYFKITDGDTYKDKYFILYTQPYKGEPGEGTPTDGGERNSNGDVEVGKTYLFFYRCFEKENLDNGIMRSSTSSKPSLAVGHSSQPVEANLIVQDHETLPDMAYIQDDSHKITIAHVNEMRGMNQIIAEYNRRAQLARLTGNTGLASYLNYCRPMFKQGKTRYTEVSNLLAQKILNNGKRDTNTCGLQWRDTGGLTDLIEKVIDKEEIVPPFDAIWDADGSTSHIIKNHFPVSPVAHDWVEHFRQCLSRNGDYYTMHTYKAAQLLRTYEKFGDKTYNWELVDTIVENWSEDYNWGLPLRCDIAQPGASYYGSDGVLYRGRIYWYTKIDQDILPDPDDITSAVLRFGWGGGWDIQTVWDGFEPNKWTLDVFLSDADAYPPTWATGLDNLLESITVYFIYGPPTEVVYEVAIDGANLAALKAKLNTPNDYLIFVFALRQEQEIPDGQGWYPYGYYHYGGFVTEPDGQSLPEDIGVAPAPPYYYGGPIYKWGAIAGATLKLFT